MSKKELTLEEYAALVGELNNKIATQEAAAQESAAIIVTLKSDVTNQAAQINTLTAEKSTLQANIETLNANLQSASVIINDLKGQVNTAVAKEESTEADNGVITHKNKKYPVMAKRFNYKGQIYELKDLIGNTALIQELIDEQTGVIGKEIK